MLPESATYLCQNAQGRNSTNNSATNNKSAKNSTERYVCIWAYESGIIYIYAYTYALIIVMTLKESLIILKGSFANESDHPLCFGTLLL
ncbi:hypothetical protein RCH20_002094 [Psychrobacter sp. PL15]|nr:hypothetical protein [Psychrobacter sp. PL15]